MSLKHRTFAHLFPTLFILFIISACGPTPTAAPTPTTIPTITSTPTASQVPTQEPTQTPYIITATPLPSTPIPPQGVFFLSLTDGGYFHLFVYSPISLQPTRLTADTWDDITPALSPDGHWLAFASHRNGYWDLYKLDLIGGEGIIRLTDTHEYDGAPSWSPDGAWIAYESYGNGNMDIFVRSVTDPGQSPKQLTQNPAADTSPAWRPNLGRQIAFVSNRSGVPEIWMANLDQAGSFIDISNSPELIASHPAWSPDGNYLAWAAADPSTGLSSIYIWDAQNPAKPARWAGSGDWPLWQDNNTLITRQTDPNQVLLTGFTTTGMLTLPPVLVDGFINGLSYGITTADLPKLVLKTAQTTQPALYAPETTPEATIVSGRDVLVNLTGVTAPYPQLHPQAVNSFQALRAKVASETGWDALGNLDNAYVPLTTPLDPGLGEDWLYTGRAFTLNPALIQQNWMVVVREDIAYQTYWRIFLHTFSQDGSQGVPLTQTPWDFSARATSSTAYENGGAPMNSIPAGYWLDLTTLAAQYGWQRLPALTNWRTYYGGARFNELAFIQGLDWQSAMLQLYPPDVLVTPTIVIPPTRTPTRTPLWYRSPTPTRTPTAHFTNTP
jgi:TolB protein